MRALVAALGLAIGTVAVYAGLRRPRRDPARQAELDRAVASIDRELAANLELTTMYDQTRQAVVLENAQFGMHGDVLERELPDMYARAAEVYARIPDAETAMERRGPAGSVRDEDRDTIGAWEGDARALQPALRAAAVAPLPMRWERLVARLRARFPSRR